MNNFSIEFPYPIGTYLCIEDDGVLHIDKVHEYVFSDKGVEVILVLNVFTDPRLSTRISIDKLLNNWTEYNRPKKKIYLKEMNEKKD